jgi:archaellum component FlaC
MSSNLPQQQYTIKDELLFLRNKVKQLESDMDSLAGFVNKLASDFEKSKKQTSQISSGSYHSFGIDTTPQISKGVVDVRSIVQNSGRS